MRLLVTAALFLATTAAPAVSGSQASYLYNLSNFGGTIPYTIVKLFVDQARHELYVADANVVRVFNPMGMEIFWFGLDPEIGLVRDVTVEPNGDIVMLTYDYLGAVDAVRFSLTRTNYRGELKEKFPLEGIHAGLSRFSPTGMVLHDGEFYLVDGTAMQVAVVDAAGRFHHAYDLAVLGGVDEKDRAGTEIGGFAVGSDGSLVFSIPTLFRVVVAAPDGTTRSFGKSGSRPGRFGIVSGVAVDRQGRIFVADVLRRVVMMFDASFGFIGEFGGHIGRPDELVGPRGIALDESGKAYVTQIRNRGVAVFSITHG